MKQFIFYISLLVIVFSCNKNTSTKEDKVVDRKTQSILSESIKRGEEVYLDMCVACHLSNGEGVKNVFPPLAKSDYLMQNRRSSIYAVKHGLKGEITVNGIKYNQIMAPLGLDNDEITDVMNYVTNAWGNQNDKMITVEEVKSIKKTK